MVAMVRPIQKGSVILGFLVMLALFGVGLLGSARWLQTLGRQEKELELLFVGQQFRDAIESYRKVGGGAYPKQLEDMLLDVRRPVVIRHLRRIYIDPMTGKAQWGLIKAPDGGILGVFSLSTQEPMKRQGFDVSDQDMEQSIRLKLESKLRTAGGDLRFEEKSNSITLTRIAGMLQTSSSSVANEPLPPDPETYSYRDWKFLVSPNVVGISGARNPGGG